MKVLVNVEPSLNTEKSGIAIYVDNLIYYLNSLKFKNFEFSYFTSFKISTHKENMKGLFVVNFLKEIIPRKFGYYLRDLSYRRSLNSFVSKKIIDLYHETTGVPCIDLEKKKISTVTTVHDLSCYRYPQFHPKDRVAWFNKNFYKRIWWSKRIIAISEFTKSEIINLVGYPENKIDVVYQGVSDIYKQILDKDEVKKYLNSIGIPEKYILFVSTIEGRKNLISLLKAYTKLPSSVKRYYYLVVVGSKGWINDDSYYQRVLEFIRRENLSDKVIFTGYKDKKELLYIYNGASLFVFPSIYEGFGLPPLEAMKCGVPVISSNRASMPEIIGNAGVLIDPYNIEELAEKMMEIIEDKKLRTDLIKRGLERSKLFTWRRTAMETVKVYKRAINDL